MGYYIETINSEMFIRKENFEKAYQALVELNKNPEYDSKKRGGASQIEYEPGKTVGKDDPRPEGYSYHPAKWFSWLPANWPEDENCGNLEDLLEFMGFNLALDESGNIHGMYYNDKIGAEHTFLEHIAEYIESGSCIDFRGEDGEMWRLAFSNNTYAYFSAEIVWK